ncbi:MAG TPA: hypothetical protein DEP48_07145 [Persephonella sp.]|uniref:hypothetical protein n=1 Tax=Persephonella TaxID=182899 RepID=UPI0005A0FA2F|nr:MULTISPECIES: hypothetical protein [Persephonella]HCB70119.1 hypothetical protein [Persephonella sp.]
METEKQDRELLKILINTLDQLDFLVKINSKYLSENKDLQLIYLQKLKNIKRLIVSQKTLICQKNLELLLIDIERIKSTLEVPR